MTIRMLINAMAPNELRIAIVEDGELVELDIEASETSTLKGNVYKGVIHNVEGSLEAAFVDIGRHKQGFLPFGEASPSHYHRPWNGKGRPKINEVLKRGQEIVVQVAKDAIGEKGATLTTYLSLPGRYTVLMPESDANGISRKIDDEKTRSRVRSIAQRIKKPENCGFIVRTAGLGQTRLALQKDLDKVVEQWRKLQKASDLARAPSIIHSEPDLIGRTLRDFFSDEIDEVLIDSKDEYEGAREYFEEVMPVYVDRLQHYQNPIPIFSYYHVEEQIEATFERQVGLPSGGSIVVDETEALVAIDVNSGRMTSEGDHERTVFKTNCEAAEEAARQLKLRDLGGIVVVDFIDMEESKHKREVERVLGEAAKADKARYKISRINSKGLCVLTRQRIRQGMRKAFQYRCPVCTGTGWLRTGESHSLSLLRRVEARLAQGGVGEVRVLTHKETADYLLNLKRSELLALERNYTCRIVIHARPEMDRGKDEVTYLSNKQVLEEITDRLPPREEKRSRNAKRRRARKPKPDTPLDAEALDGKADPRTKRRRKRGRGRPEAEAIRSAPILASEPAANGDAQSARDTVEAGSPHEGPSSSGDRIEPKGSTTFTGRPSPEQLERARAERRARQARRNGNAGVSIEGSESLASAESPRDSAAALGPEPIPTAVEEQAPLAAPAADPVSMDVMHALAVADAVLRTGTDAFDEAAVLAAAGVTDELDDLDAAPEPNAPGLGKEPVGERSERSVAEPNEPLGREDEQLGLPLEDSDTEPVLAEAAQGFDNDITEDERKARKRRRRRRGRRRRDEDPVEGREGLPDGQMLRSEASPATETVEPVDEGPSRSESMSQAGRGRSAAKRESDPAESATGSGPIDPKTEAARRALVHRIFSSR